MLAWRDEGVSLGESGWLLSYIIRSVSLVLLVEEEPVETGIDGVVVSLEGGVQVAVVEEEGALEGGVE